jgi:uncharacterized sodium:solute symporter family permease YidK
MPDIQERRTRTHGFMEPLHTQQISTFFVFGLDLITYYAVFMPSLAEYSEAMWFCTITYFIICVLVVYYCLKATRTDPTDPVIYE